MTTPVIGKKDKILAAAQKFLDRNQLDKALAEFAKVVQEDPKDTRTWLKMAEVHAKRGAVSEATEIYLKTGELYTEQGFFQKSVAVYKNVLKLSPGLVQGHIKLGDVYKRLGLLSDALGQLEAAVAVHQKAGKPADALAVMRQIADLNPDNAVARVKLAEAASQAGAVEDAVREFGKAAEKLKAQGRTDDFARVAERLLFHQPDNLDIARELADAYIAKQNPRQALARLQAPLKADPRDPRTVSLLARAFEQLDVPKAASVWRELAEIHHAAGRLVERDEALRKAMGLAPGDAEVQERARRWGIRPGPSAAGANAPVAAGGNPGLPLLRPPPPSSSPSSSSGGAPGTSHLPDPQGSGGRRGLPTPLGLTSQGRFKMDIGAGAAGGAAGPQNPDVSRIMAETEVFVKYGLLDRAVDHLRRVFELQPHDQAAREKLSSVLVQLGRKTEAAAELVRLATHLASTDRPASIKLAERALELDPSLEAARTLANPASSAGSSSAASRSSSAAPAAQEAAPESGRTGDLSGSAVSQDVLVATSEDIVRADDEFMEADDVEIEVDPEGSEDGPEVLAFEDDPLSEVNRGRNLSDGELRSELEQVDFFIEQAMPDEAGALLTDLQQRFGSNPVIDRKMHEVRQLAAAASPGAIPGAPATVVDSPSRGRQAPPVARVAGGGTADLSTHGDLGIAYKEMGLWEPAIAEFKILSRDPKRQVFALTMIGECMESMGTMTDAVIRYKEALNCPQATATESTVLYYLLGLAFERLNDRPEALYFYDKVARRDPQFRDIKNKLAALRPPSARRA